MATVFVSPDCTELQIAATVGTRCIGLFGSAIALKNAPFGWLHRAVHVLPENISKKQKRAAMQQWMDAIPAELVCEKCDEVLAEILEVQRPDIVQLLEEQVFQKKAA
jgi:ADP-heptose:LPS heptosyltransferase